MSGVHKINRLRRKIDHVEDILSNYITDIPALTETWLDPTGIGNGNLNITGYKLLQQDRTAESSRKSTGGGVWVYFQDSLPVRDHRGVGMPRVELLWMSFQVQDQSEVLTGCCYRPPLAPIAYWEDIQPSLELI